MKKENFGQGPQSASEWADSVFWARLLFIALFALLGLRLAFLQLVLGGQIQNEAFSRRTKTIRTSAQRGLLFDRDGALLVANEPACAIEIDPNDWFNNNAKLSTDSVEARKQRTFTELAGLLPDVDMAKWENAPLVKGKSGRYRTWPIVSSVSFSLGEAIKKANLPGVGVRSITQRVAWNGDFAPHVLGFTGRDGNGLDGMENRLNDVLTGKRGELVAEFDRRGKPIPTTILTEKPPTDGRNVVLTIHSGVQKAVQSALGAACEMSHAEWGTAVVLDPKTGDILALANYPTYNVNHRQNVPYSYRLNRAVSAPFEPGSTLKMITVAAALEEKAVTSDQKFYCGGSFTIGKRTIHGAQYHPFEHGHGEETLLDILKNSCNVATAECAFRLGSQKLALYERKFGLDAKTGAGLPGESRGQMSKPETWSQIQLANVGFGQGISVTALQLAAAYGVIANDGVYQAPRIVWGQEEDDELKPAPLAPGRRVVSVQTAREMQKMLQAVVDSGTGTKAQLTGYSAGGKTGTAQIAEHGSYENRKFTASFVGMAPMQNPQFVIAVSLTDPKGSYYGGQVSAPVFKEIAEYALLARRVPHDKAIVRPKNTGINAAMSND